MLLLLMPMEVFASVGFAPLGITSPRFPCSRFIRLHKTLPYKTLAFLPLSFGRDTKCLAKLATQKPGIWLHAYLSNESCRRLNRCDKTELLPRFSTGRYKRTLIKRPKSITKPIQNRLKKILDTYSGFGKLTIVTGLEDDLSRLERESLIRIIREVYHGPLIQNPLVPGTAVKHVTLEYHRVFDDHKPTRFTPRTIYNNDGASPCEAGRRCALPDLSMSTLCDSLRQSRASTKLIWSGMFNGIRFQGRRFIYPARRSFDFSNQDARQLKALFKCATTKR